MMTLANYTVFSVLLLFVLYFIVVNINVKKKPKAEGKPTIKPMKLFVGTNGLTDKKIKELFKTK